MTLYARVRECSRGRDSEYDACMVRYAGVGVAFCPTSPVLRLVADRVVQNRDLRALLEFVQ